MGNYLSVKSQNPSFEETADQEGQIKEIPQIGTINVLSFNMFVRPPFINNNGDDFKDERLAGFLQKTHTYDIICLQEMFQSYSRRHSIFLQQAQEAGFLFNASSPAIRTFSTFLIDGGLVILSRYPIVHSEFYQYPYGLGVDYYVQKGVLYAKIRVGNTFLHIFNSHTQANYEDKISCFIKKTQQLMTFQKFVNETLERNNYTDADQVLLMGDLNVDANSKLRLISKELMNRPELENFALLNKKEEFSEYETLINCLSNDGQEDVDDLVFKDNKNVHPVTFGDYTLSRKKEKIPLETALTVKHSLCTKQSLDYIFKYVPKTLLTSKKGKSTSPVEKLVVKRGSAKVEKFLVKGHRRFTQLSDHYGIRVTLQYQKTSSNK